MGQAGSSPAPRPRYKEPTMIWGIGEVIGLAICAAVLGFVLGAVLL